MKKLHGALIVLLWHASLWATQVAIVGCGYVGLTLAAILSRENHTVVCVDIQQERIAQLNNKMLPIYEPELEDALFHVPASNAITFIDDIHVAADADIFYLSVSTPTGEKGSCDCSYLRAAFDDVVRVCADTQSKKIICIKSTVPPGTIRKLHNALVEKGLTHIDVVYNPEFMREGSALRDIYNNPIVLGGESVDAMQKIEDLYAYAAKYPIEIIKTNFETAEIIKYAWNAFSAIRIAYVNELALLCRLFGADIEKVIKGFAQSEQVLPTEALRPGPGFGGSCLPKDVASFSKIMEEQGFSCSMMHQALASNANHKKRVIQDVLAALGTTGSRKTVTILGLSFKPNTDDIRNSPAIDLIQALTEKGVWVKAYDPKAMNNMKAKFSQVQYYNSPYNAVMGTDCIVVLTEWDEIKKIDLGKVASLCKKKVLIDTRNIYDTQTAKKHGFHYVSMGKQ